MRENASFHSRRSRQSHLGVGPLFPHFSKQDVADNCLGQLIEAAHVAPSGWNLQTWRWIVVRGDSSKKYLEAATYSELPLSSAPVVLICLADTLAWKSASQGVQEMIANRKITEEEGHETLRRLREHYASSPEVAKRTALAHAFVVVHQTLLGLAEYNLSAYWVTEFDEAKIKTYLHIPDHFLVAALLPVGYCEERPTPAVTNLPVRTVIYKEKFGETLSLAS